MHKYIYECLLPHIDAMLLKIYDDNYESLVSVKQITKNKKA